MIQMSLQLAFSLLRRRIGRAKLNVSDEGAVRLTIGTEHTKAASDDPRPEVGRGFVEDHEIDVVTPKGAPDRADKTQTFLEALAVRAENAAIQQNGHVQVTLAMGASLRVAPEEISGRHPLRRRFLEEAFQFGGYGFGHAISISQGG